MPRLWLSPGVLWVTLKYHWPQEPQERCFATCLPPLYCFKQGYIPLLPSHLSSDSLWGLWALITCQTLSWTLPVSSLHWNKNPGGGVYATFIQREEDGGFKSVNPGRTSLVAQSIGVCLPMSGAGVRSLVWEDSTCHGASESVCPSYWSLCPLELSCLNSWAHMLWLLKSTHPRACAPQKEKPAMRSYAPPGAVVAAHRN